VSGTTHDQRGSCHQRLELDVEFGAEAAPEERHLHAHAVFGPAQQPCNLDTHERRALRRRVDRQSIAGRIRRRHERLQRQMQHLLRSERVLEDVGRRRKARGRIAVPQMEIECDVGIAFAVEMFQIRECARRLEHLVHDGLGRHRLDFVVDGRQRLVLYLHEPGCSVGNVGIRREHERHGLARMTHLVDRKDRLIVECGPVMGIGNQRADVFGGEDAMHARHRLRGADIDTADAAMGDRAAHDRSVQHAGQRDVMDIGRSPRELRLRFLADERASDLRRGGSYAAHAGTPPLRIASRNARATCTRSSSRL
jgi:hypothetical protein